MRSKLFVPGSRPELFSKALMGPADSLSFDLEDAVREDRKAEARNSLAEFLTSDAVAQSHKTMIVRINPVGTAHYLEDLRAVVCSGVDIINVPKPEGQHDIQEVAELVMQIEREKGLNRDGKSPIRLLINIESPKALRTAHELGAAHERIMGLQLGLGDLFEPYGIHRREPVAVYGAMFQMVMAAHENGIKAYDGAFTNVADRDGLEAEARMAKHLGFHGKSCIHPSQVETVNAVFRPTDQEIEYAIKVVEAEAKAKEASVGAFMVEGKMIDGPFVDRARSILQTAQQLGLLSK